MILAATIIGIILIVLVLVLGGLALFTAWTARRVEAALPPPGHFIEIDGARLHYIDEGTGPAIVFIHGLAGQTGNFTYALSDLLKRDHRVIILDRPGNGYSTRPEGASATISAQAQTIARFIGALGLERPLIVGHSLGGAIALSVALDHQAYAGGLALLAPATHPQTSVPKPFTGLFVTSPILRRLIGWTLAIPASIMGREAAFAMLFGPQTAPADFATRGRGLLSLRPQSFIAASEDLVASVADLDGLHTRYPTLTLPVGIIYGADDRILDADKHGKAMRTKVKDLDYEEIGGGGHMILVVSADRCAEFIRRIAQRVAAGGAEAAPIA